MSGDITFVLGGMGIVHFNEGQKVSSFLGNGNVLNEYANKI